MQNIFGKLQHYSDQMSIGVHSNNGKLFDESCHEFDLLLEELNILVEKQHLEIKKQDNYNHCLSVVR